MGAVIRGQEAAVAEAAGQRAANAPTDQVSPPPLP